MNLAGPEPQYLEAVSLENAVPHEVVLRLSIIGMLSTVHLDDHAARVADEVEEIATERSLPTDAKAAVAEQLETAPEHDLGLAHGMPRVSGALDCWAHALKMFYFCSRNKPVLRARSSGPHSPTLAAARPVPPH